MIRSFLHKGAQDFGAKYGYDTTYMHEIIDTSRSAGVRLALFPMVTRYSGPKQAMPVWFGALLASTLDGDCGPCAQLTIDMAVEAGADPDHLRLCATGQADQAGDTGLGFRFAKAAITDDPQADVLRGQIEAKFGKQAVVAAGFAAATGRMYPVLKRSMGWGKTCQRLTFNGVDTPLNGEPA